MKALIFSDSHGNDKAMQIAIEDHPDAEYFFFLGDGLREAERLAQSFPRLAFVAVPGNMDFGYARSFSGPMQEVTLDIEGKRILLTHGHLRGVKSGLNNIAYLAEEKSADVVLYGHTHIPYCKCLSGPDGEFYLFNPGSIGRPYGDAAPSYGILQILDGKIYLFHGRVVG